MNIIKRSGAIEQYDGQKIIRALQKVFAATSERYSQAELEQLLAQVEARITKVMQHDDAQCPDMQCPDVQRANVQCTDVPSTEPTVELIQDLVEEALMRAGYFKQAKGYILYRSKRSELRTQRSELIRLAGDDDLLPVLLDIEKDFEQELYPLDAWVSRFEGLAKPEMNPAQRLDTLARAAAELCNREAPQWSYIAARIRAFAAHKALAQTMASRGISNLYDKIQMLVDADLYGSYILENYSREEILQAQEFLNNERDKLFDYAGLDLVLRRYVIRSHEGEILETPQEMFLGVALHLAMKEEHSNRLTWVAQFYNMLSTLEVTMATPTLSNARKPHHQLSSCFIDTVPDSLEGIYRSIDNFSQVSKFGGGMGMYLGKVRASGGSIRGFQGVAGGVIRWIRVINDTAVAVDQLGMRAGAVAVYLDAWHRDLPEFLQIRTNNGDDRTKAHDVFPAVCYPDLFWKLAQKDMSQEWHLMDPHEILTIKGYALEEYFGEEWERRYLECVADARIAKRSMPIREIVRLIIRSAVETGTPFAFMRDTVNRANPNPHAGIIYCSNLCTEIAQNTSSMETVSREIVTDEGDTVVVTTVRPGDFVVCNLASLSLGNINLDDTQHVRELVHTVVRALDNVIDLNFYALPYAKITNHRYRSIGLGVSGYHHMLAQRAIRWESEEHLDFVDQLFEKINRFAIEASCNLAAERGSYELFEGSDWQTGAYFEKRAYTGKEWDAVRAQVAANGMRNAYLLAIAPTSSTSILAGTTAGLDPIMQSFFLEEKKGMMLPRIAPELSFKTCWYYKPAHSIDQHWSIRAAAIRQRHIDQAQSMNLYITNDFTMRQVFDLYVDAWARGVKTVYYVRSKSLEVEECESCAS